MSGFLGVKEVKGVKTIEEFIKMIFQLYNDKVRKKSYLCV